MLLKVLKWVGIALGTLVALILVAIVGLNIAGESRFRHKYSVPSDALTIPTDAASIERGKHIAAIRECRGCHQPDFSGRVFIDMPSLAVIASRNLTPGQGGIGKTFTDGDYVRAIRYGVNPEGEGMMIMPSPKFYYLSDEDLADLIAYLKALPPVDHEVPQRSLGMMGRMLLAMNSFAPLAPDVIATQGLRPVVPPAGPTAAYGEYLAHTCQLCHADNLAGMLFPPGQPDAKLTPNLTPGGNLVGWSKDDFFKALRTGVKPDGSTLQPLMPYSELGQMTDDELTAVWLYLKSLPKTKAPEVK